MDQTKYSQVTNITIEILIFWHIFNGKSNTFW